MTSLNRKAKRTKIRTEAVMTCEWMIRGAVESEKH